MSSTNVAYLFVFNNPSYKNRDSTGKKAYFVCIIMKYFHHDFKCSSDILSRRSSKNPYVDR